MNPLYVIYFKGKHQTRWQPSSDYAPFSSKRIAWDFCREITAKDHNLVYKAVRYIPDVTRRIERNGRES